jgi:hypothetical protein
MSMGYIKLVQVDGETVVRDGHVDCSNSLAKQAEAKAVLDCVGVPGEVWILGQPMLKYDVTGRHEQNLIHADNIDRSRRMPADQLCAIAQAADALTPACDSIRAQQAPFSVD